VLHLLAVRTSSSSPTPTIRDPTSRYIGLSVCSFILARSTSMSYPNHPHSSFTLRTILINSFHSIMLRRPAGVRRACVQRQRIHNMQSLATYLPSSPTTLHNIIHILYTFLVVVAFSILILLVCIYLINNNCICVLDTSTIYTPIYIALG
jgi:hypothetical protein